MVEEGEFDINCDAASMHGEVCLEQCQCKRGCPMPDDPIGWLETRDNLRCTWQGKGGHLLH